LYEIITTIINDPNTDSETDKFDIRYGFMNFVYYKNTLTYACTKRILHKNFYREKGNFYYALDKLFEYVSTLITSGYLGKLEYYSKDYIINLECRYPGKVSLDIDNLLCSDCNYYLLETCDDNETKLLDKYFSKATYELVNDFLNNNELIEFENILKNGTRVFSIIEECVSTYNIVYTKVDTNTCHSCSHKNFNLTHCILYVNCRECFRIYVKISEYLEKIVATSFSINIYDTRDDNKLEDLDFIFHICKDNGLENLLKMIMINGYLNEDNIREIMTSTLKSNRIKKCVV